MPATTLLDMTQGILSDMDSDEISELADTTEAMQVARIIRNVFSEICDEYYLETNKELLQLEGLADTDHPTHLRIPAGVYSIQSFEYNIQDNGATPLNFRRIQFLEPEDFLKIVTLNNQDDDVQEITDFGGAMFQVRTNQDPHYYTSFDHEYIVCDAWNSDVTATMVASRTRVYASSKPALVLDGDTEIDLPEHLISLLRAEASVRAFDMFKDGAPPSVMRNAMRQRVRAKRLKHAVKERRPIDLLPDYGRKV